MGFSSNTMAMKCGPKAATYLDVLTGATLMKEGCVEDECTEEEVRGDTVSLLEEVSHIFRVVPSIPFICAHKYYKIL